MMDWSTMMERYGWKTEEVGSEPFTPLASQVAQAKAAGQPVARLTVTAGTSHDYGAVKVSVSVSVECPQNEASMNLAGESAFWKATELVNDCASHVGAPQLGKPG